MRREHIPRFFDAQQLAVLAERHGARAEDTIEDFDQVPVGELARIEVLVTGWASPMLTPARLDLLPRLRAVIHTTGSVKALLEKETWGRGFLVSSAADQNALPVAEYALAMILLGAKQVLETSAAYRDDPTRADALRDRTDVGAFRTTVGVIGASRIGRRLLELLAAHDFEVVVFDPFLPDEEAQRLGVRSVALDELLRRSRIVSIHAPSTAQTRGMIGARELAAMPDGALLVNTSRAALLDQDALVAEVRSGRLRAVLDVTEPEVLPAGHPLLTLPGVVVTPHIAGAGGNELRRLGSSAFAEIARLDRGERLLHEVDDALLPISA
jgi:phosphoglycerate dehydrogenase-like enzyme